MFKIESIKLEGFTLTMNNMEHDLEWIATKVHKYWEKRNDGSSGFQVPTTQRRQLDGLISEVHVVIDMFNRDYTDICPYGLLEQLWLARKGNRKYPWDEKRKAYNKLNVYGKNHPSQKRYDCADIEATHADGSRITVEVKSGRPARYPHRQFKVNYIDSYIHRHVSYVVWVDIAEDNTCEIYQGLSPQAIKRLEIKKNSYQSPCYTLTGGY